jgi:hypothetical protein
MKEQDSKSPGLIRKERAISRYKNTIGLLRRVTRGNLTREEQEWIAYKINHIDKHGFEFIPNHYVMSEVVELERFAQSKLENL